MKQVVTFPSSPTRFFHRLVRHLGLGCVIAALLSALLPSAWSQVAPTLTSVTPARGATGVAVNAPLVFTFDQSINDSLPIIPSMPPFLIGNIEFTPADSVNYDHAWSAAGRTLTLTPSGDLPPNTTISWKLNPPGSALPLSGANGSPLATATGSFTTRSGDGGGGGGGDDTGPKLVASDPPAEGALNVDPKVNVVFTFDQAMKKVTALGDAIAWIGADAAKFVFSWSADGKVLTCDYSQDFPTQTVVGWSLNPGSSTVKIESATGDALPDGTYSGGFMTQAGAGGGNCNPEGIPDGWGNYSISKSGDYVQASAADPVPEDSRPFGFAAIIFSPDAGPNATTASVTLPNATQKPLVAPGVINALLYADTAPKTAAALETSYPAGNYTLRFTQTGQPERVISMTMPASNPPVPKFANYSEAQNINIAKDFTLSWNAFAGASAKDHIGLVIIDGMGKTVFQAPDKCVPRELAVTATSVVIPANTFKSGGTYEASLSFSKMFYFSDNTVANMVGSGAIANTTRMTFNTGGGGTVGPARFTSYKLLPNAEPELTLLGTPGSMYRIERTGNLTPPVSWITVGSARTDGAGNAVFPDSQAGNLFPLFYRAVNP